MINSISNLNRSALGFGLQRYLLGFHEPSHIIPADRLDLRQELDNSARPYLYQRLLNSNSNNIHTQREEYLLQKIFSAPSTAHLVVPWGASHMQPIAEKLQHMGFREKGEKRLRRMCTIDGWDICTSWWARRWELLTESLSWPTPHKLFLHLYEKDTTLAPFRRPSWPN